MARSIVRAWPFLVAWVVGLATVVWAGTRVDGYRLHVMEVPLPHPYPTEGVISVGIAVTVEVLILLVILRSRSDQRSLGRLLGALVLLVAVLMTYGPMLMHAPPYHLFHWLWLAIVTLVVFITMIVSVVAAARSPTFAERHTSAGASASREDGHGP